VSDSLVSFTPHTLSYLIGKLLPSRIILNAPLTRLPTRERLTGVLAGGNGSVGAVTRIIGDKRLFRLTLMVAVALGIAGASQASGSTPLNGNTLRIVSAAIFLVLTVLTGYRTVLLARVEMMRTFLSPRLMSGFFNFFLFTVSEEKSTQGDAKRSSFVLCVIALLLLIREIFAIATVGNSSKQNNEHLWYPLYALPEILAVALYATPNLVPPRAELPT
jgi:hypothetical protein